MCTFLLLIVAVLSSALRAPGGSPKGGDVGTENNPPAVLALDIHAAHQGPKMVPGGTPSIVIIPAQQAPRAIDARRRGPGGGVLAPRFVF